MKNTAIFLAKLVDYLDELCPELCGDCRLKIPKIQGIKHQLLITKLAELPFDSNKIKREIEDAIEEWENL